MASGFGPEGPCSIPDTVQDQPSACGVRTRKIRGSESHVDGRWKKIPYLSETHQNRGGGQWMVLPSIVER